MARSPTTSPLTPTYRQKYQSWPTCPSPPSSRPLETPFPRSDHQKKPQPSKLQGSIQIHPSPPQNLQHLNRADQHNPIQNLRPIGSRTPILRPTYKSHIRYRSRSFEAESEGVVGTDSHSRGKRRDRFLHLTRDRPHIYQKTVSSMRQGRSSRFGGVG